MKKSRMRQPLGLLTLLSFASLPLVCPPHAGAADWPSWRGPNRDDISPESDLLSEWPAGGPQKRWMSEKAGLG
ncbi:MAG: hypothetical protein RLZZ142_2186, partial [Verrucomicrobiota bacterium]